MAAEPSLAAALADFHARDSAHLAEWEPPPEAGVVDAAFQAARLAVQTAAFAAGSGFRHLLQPIGDPTRMIGRVHLSNVVRGAFQSCNLGHALDQRCEGQPLMTEALRALIAEMFGGRVNLHRIQAAYRPEN